MIEFWLPLLEIVRCQFHDERRLPALWLPKTPRTRLLETLKTWFLILLSWRLFEGIWFLRLAPQETLCSLRTFRLSIKPRVVGLRHPKHRAFVSGWWQSLRLFPLVTRRQSSWGSFLGLLLNQLVDWHCKRGSLLQSFFFVRRHFLCLTIRSWPIKTSKTSVYWRQHAVVSCLKDRFVRCVCITARGVRLRFLRCLNSSWCHCFLIAHKPIVLGLKLLLVYRLFIQLWNIYLFWFLYSRWPKCFIIFNDIIFTPPRANIWSLWNLILLNRFIILSKFISLRLLSQPLKLLEIIDELIPLVILKPNWRQVSVKSILTLNENFTLVSRFRAWHTIQVVWTSPTFVAGTNCTLVLRYSGGVVQRFEEIEQGRAILFTAKLWSSFFLFFTIPSFFRLICHSLSLVGCLPSSHQIGQVDS